MNTRKIISDGGLKKIVTDIRDPGRYTFGSTTGPVPDTTTKSVLGFSRSLQATDKKTGLTTTNTFIILIYSSFIVISLHPSTLYKFHI